MTGAVSPFPVVHLERVHIRAIFHYETFPPDTTKRVNEAIRLHRAARGNLVSVERNRVPASNPDPDPELLALRNSDEPPPVPDVPEENHAKYLNVVRPFDDRLRPFTEALAALLLADLFHDNQPK